MAQNIDKLGAEVAAQMKKYGDSRDKLDKDSQDIAAKLRLVWIAFERKEVVNGCKTRTAWTKKWNISMRYCQYLVRDGSRKNQQTRTTVRVAKLDALVGKKVSAHGKEFLFTKEMMAALVSMVEEPEKPAQEQPKKKTIFAPEPTCPACPEALKKEEPHPEVVAMEKTLAATAAVGGAKLVHETAPGGPRVLEVAIPGEFSSDPPRLKYYVCVGDQKHPHPTLDAAKAACDKMLGWQGQPTYISQGC